MQNVKVKKDELLAVLMQNRVKHVNEYESAKKIYREDVVAKLEELLAAARCPSDATG